MVLGVVLAFAAQELWWTAADSSEKHAAEGVPNFGIINEHLYRGAQPTSVGFETLRRLGVQRVVRLSMGEEGSNAEEREVRGLGMDFVAIPWSTQHDPTDDQVTAFLSAMRDAHDQRVFVHCKAGSDRTGVMIALYRIAADGWPASAAVSEMEAFHFRPLSLLHLQRFVEAFPAHLQADSNLRALASGL
jgi:protein tyrosine/serine phosphatase